MNRKAKSGHLLNASTMARFAVDGFVEFDDLVPPELSEEVHHDALAYPANRVLIPTCRVSFWMRRPQYGKCLN